MTESHTLAHWQASGQRQAETIREQDAEIARLRAEVARLTAPVADEAMVEKAAIAICRTSCVLPECSWGMCCDWQPNAPEARAVLAAVTPMIVAAERERCIAACQTL